MLLKRIKLIKSLKKKYFIDNIYYVRLLSKKDISLKYLRWLKDSQINQYTEQKFLKHTLKTTEKYLVDKIKSNNDLFFGIFKKLNNNEKHLGNIKITILNYNDERADISYIIGDKKSWGQGLATKSIAKMIELCKKNLKLKKITAGCYENNIASLVALKKNGFVEEGRNIKNVRWKNKRIDTLSLGIIL